MDATKNIRIKTIVDNSQGVQLLDAQGNAIKRVEQELSKTAVTAQGKLSPALNVSRRDLGIFASQLAMTAGASGKFTSQLSNLATGLATGGLYGAAFAGFAVIVNALTEEFKSSEEVIKGLIPAYTDIAKIIEGMRDSFRQAKTEAIALNEASSLDKLQKLTEEMKWLKLDLRTNPDEFQRAALRTQIEGKQAEIDFIVSLWSKVVEKQKESKEIIKDINKLYMEQFSHWKGMGLDTSAQVGAINFMGRGLPGVRGTQMNPPNPMDAMIKSMNEEGQMEMQQFSEVSASMFANNMNQAWESIFGEANSMFEQMLSAWQGMLFEKIGFGIFNMLFGGMDLFGFARNLTAGNATAARYGMNR